MSIRKLSIESFQSLERSLPEAGFDSYISVYDNLLRAVSNLRKLEDEDSLIAVAHIAYGWMPTMLTFDKDRVGELNFFHNAKKGSIDESFLDAMKSMVNNSIVGASKVLHFFYPHLYPIWDSRVYSAIYKLPPYDYRVNKVSCYQEYVERLRVLATSSHAMDQIKGSMVSKRYCFQEASNIRVLELVLFYSH